MQKTATKVQTEITATAIYKVTVKETGKTCYAVPSDSQEGVYYITCFDNHTASWTCTCPAGKFGKTCKHARAAQVSILANKVTHRLAQVGAHVAEKHEELGSCDTCGYQVKPGVTTCAKCLGY